MAQSGYTPIQLYRTATPSAAPTAGNLADGELAINTVDEKLYFKNSAGTVKLLAANVTPAENGGTGQSSYTVGDLLFASGSTTLSKLADVATGNALISGGVGVAPSYGKIGLTTHVSGILPVANGGTNIATYAVGDILYASTTGVLSRLADVATGNALISGGVGVAPSYGKIGLTTHVSGTLPVANGGTGTATAFTAGSVIFAGASGVYSQDNASLFFDNTNNRLGIGTATPAVKLAIVGTDAVLIPVGTTAERPTGATGYLRFNSTSASFEGYNGTAWGSIGGGATGGGTDQMFYLNGQTVNTSYSIPVGQNAGTFGSITIASGATVTVPSGSTWTVV